MDRDYLVSRIAVTKTAIEELENTIATLRANGGVVSYTLDTGQTKQSATRADIPSLEKTLDSLYARLTNFQNRLNGRAAQGRPAW